MHPASTVVCLVNGPRQEDLVQIARECAAATAFAASLNLQLGTVAVHEFTVTIRYHFCKSHLHLDIQKSNQGKIYIIQVR